MRTYGVRQVVSDQLLAAVDGGADKVWEMVELLGDSKLEHKERSARVGPWRRMSWRAKHVRALDTYGAEYVTVVECDPDDPAADAWWYEIRAFAEPIKKEES